MKISFTANIVAEVKDTPETKKGGVSITSVIAKLARGEMKIEMPQFIVQPTIILTEKDNVNNKTIQTKKG